MWNNAEHLVAYLAVPSMGAVLHTLNLRLFPEQLIYIVNHAEDRVVIVDSTLIPLLAGVLPHLTTLRHVVVVGDGDMSPLAQASAGQVQLHRWADLLADKPDHYDWPVVDERDAAALCYTSGTTGNPKGVAIRPSLDLPALDADLPARRSGSGRRASARNRADVPRHGMGFAVRGVPLRRLNADAGPLPPGRATGGDDRAERPTLAGAVPTIWTDLLAYLDANPTDISSMKEVIVGGSACPPALMHAYSERHGMEIIHAWGMTEMSPLGSVSRSPAGLTGPEAWAYRYTQGRVPAAVQARIVGPDGR